MFYFTTYQTYLKQEFWFTITEKLSGKVKHTSAAYPTVEETEIIARSCVAHYEAIARRDEEDYLKSIGESSERHQEHSSCAPSRRRRDK